MRLCVFTADVQPGDGLLFFKREQVPALKQGVNRIEKKKKLAGVYLEKKYLAGCHPAESH